MKPILSTMNDSQIVVILVLCWSQEGMSLHSTELDFSVIPDLGVRNVTKELHHFCPYVRLCRVNMTDEDLFYMTFNPPCCLYCSCCEEEAPYFGDACCPDVLDSLLTPEDVQQTLAREKDCVYAQYRRFIPGFLNGQAYTMTVNCPSTYTNSTIRHNCRTDYAELDITLDNFSSFFPVSVNRSGDLVTYKNKYCAVCSGVPEENLLRWRIALSCIIEPGLIEPLTEIQRVVTEGDHCNLLFLEPVLEDFVSTFDTCEAVIDRCNVTGLWQQYDPTMEAACLSYTVRYKDFKNIHCYFCNGYGEGTVTRLCPTYESEYHSTSSFLLLLDFNDLEKQEIGEDGNFCSENEIYDSLQKQCLRPKCSPMMKLDENRSACIPKYPYANRMKFEVVFALFPKMTKTGVHIVSRDIGNDINSNIKQSLLLLLLNFGVRMDNVETFIKVNKTVEEMVRLEFPLRLRDVLYIGVRLSLSTWEILDLQSTIRDLLELRVSKHLYPLMDILNYEIPSYIFDNSTVKVYQLSSAAAGSSLDITTSPWTPNARAMHPSSDTPPPSTVGNARFPHAQHGTAPTSTRRPVSTGDSWSNSSANRDNNQSFETTAVPNVRSDTRPEPNNLKGVIIMEDDRDGLAILPLPYPAANPFIYGSSWLPVTPLQFCPKIKLTGEYFTINMLNQTVLISDLDLEMNLSQVILNLEENEITICTDSYMRALSIYQGDLTTKDNGRLGSSYSAQVILSVILSCLSLTCLLITLVTYVVYKNLRTLAGKNNMVLVTWLFMTQFLFLIVSQVEINTPWLCTAVGIMLHFSLLSAFSWMNVCTFHMTRVFSTIETTSITRQSNSSAFAKYVRFATLLPILFVVIHLTVSLVHSDMLEIGYGGYNCYIARKKTIGYTVAIPLGFVVIADLIMFLVVIYKVKHMPDIHKNKRRDFKNVLMFAKLSTITGLTWIFGFIYQWSSVTAFAYLFIILNASQGVFIMLAFIVKRQVILIIRGKSSSRDSKGVKT